MNFGDFRNLEGLMKDRTVTMVAVMRHGKKTGDALTLGGMAQVTTAAKKYAKTLLEYHPFLLINEFYYSGANRTKQSAELVVEVLLHHQFMTAEVVTDTGFSFEDVFRETLGGSEEAYEADLKKVKDAGGTIGDALLVSRYAPKARAKLEGVLARVANNRRHDGLVWALSHSPYAELASRDLGIPYGIPEAAMVLYAVRDGKVVDSFYFTP